MHSTGSAAGGGRWIDVAPGRFPGWIGSFAARHGAAGPDAVLAVGLAGEAVIFTAPDGAVAECHPPFPPAGPPAAAGSPAGDWAAAITAHALAVRTVGVLLVRLGGYAAGVFSGSPPVLAASKTGSRLVHGRSAAGGWSQHRFARRREKQAAEAVGAAADAAVQVFSRWGTPGRLITARGGPQARGGAGGARGPSDRSRGPAGAGRTAAEGTGEDIPGRSGDAAAGREGAGGQARVRSGKTGTASGSRAESGGTAGGRVHSGALDAVVLGGDRRAVAVLREDPRLAPYLDLAVDRFLTVPDPKLAVLRDAPRLFLAVRIWLTEPRVS